MLTSLYCIVSSCGNW